MENILISKDIFKVQNEQIWVSSIDVAKYYGIEHYNLLKAIDNKLVTLPELAGVNINVSEYKDKSGKRNKCYLLEMMLEPTELGTMFKEELAKLGFTHTNPGVNANRFLQLKGVQNKNNGFWVANDGFEQYTFRNVWNSKTKEGYNLKWNIDFFRSLINN